MAAINIARRHLLCMSHHILSSAASKRGLCVYNACHQRIVKPSSYSFHVCWFSTSKMTYSKHSEDINKKKKENKPDAKHQSKVKKDLDNMDVRLFDINGLLIGEMKYKRACDRAKGENLKLEKLKCSEQNQKNQVDHFQLVEKKKSKKTEKQMSFSARIEEHNIMINLNKIRTFLKKNYKVVVVVGNKSSGTEEELLQVKKIVKLIQSELKDVAEVRSATSSGMLSRFTLMPLSTTDKQTSSSDSTADSEDK